MKTKTMSPNMIKYLAAIRDDELQVQSDDAPFHTVWAAQLNHGLTRNVAGGIASQAQKKGYVVISDYDDNVKTVVLTKVGFEALTAAVKGQA